jgi:hypothetical protein
MIFIAVSADEFLVGLINQYYLSHETLETRRRGHALNFVHNIVIGVLLEIYYILYIQHHLQSVYDDVDLNKDVWTGMISNSVEMNAVVFLNYA